MQITYNNVPADSLNAEFWETIKDRFAGKNVSIVVKEDELNQPRTQLETFHKLEKLRRKLRNVKVDPSIDLSALANEVNL